MNNGNKLEQMTILKINFFMVATMASDVEDIHKQLHMNRPKTELINLRLLIYQQVFVFINTN